MYRLLSKIKPLVSASCIVAVIILTLFSGKDSYSNFQKLSKPKSVLYTGRNPGYLSDMYSWIRNNTEKDTTFLSCPYHIGFYPVAQRAQFVSYKHLPQSEEGIIEWYERMLEVSEKERNGKIKDLKMELIKDKANAGKGGKLKAKEIKRTIARLHTFNRLQREDIESK